MFCLTIFRKSLLAGPERRKVSTTRQTGQHHVSHHPSNDDNNGQNCESIEEAPAAMDAEDATVEQDRANLDARQSSNREQIKGNIELV